MKVFGARVSLLSFLFLVASLSSYAQDYLVTVKGDTMTGVLKPLMFGPEKKMQVVGADRKKTILSIFQIRSYSMAGEMFQPVKGANGYTFMKVLKSGYLSLYAFQLENQVTYDGRFLQKRDGSGTEIPNLSFKKTISKFLEDCGGLTKKIEDGDLTRKHIEQIVDEYNACINTRTAQVLAPATKAPPATVQVDQAKLDPWQTLEDKVKGLAEFEGKTNALEMISEVKSKVAKNEKVPNFMVQGLKEILTQPELQEDLTNALKVLP
jgi:hypothetical protein